MARLKKINLINKKGLTTSKLSDNMSTSQVRRTFSMKYQVNFFDPRNGAESPIDTITAPEGYTADQYVKDCEDNADQEWIDMLHAGEVSLEILSTLKIFYVGIQKLNASEYQMGPELMEAEYGDEWDGDVNAYLFNTLSGDDYEGCEKELPGVALYENWYGLEPKNIMTCYLTSEDGTREPHEIYFAAYDDDEWTGA